MKIWLLIVAIVAWGLIDAQTTPQSTTTHTPMKNISTSHAQPTHVPTTHRPKTHVPPTAKPSLHDLRIEEGHTFLLSNIYRPGGSLKFSLRGVNLTGPLDHHWDNVWESALSDGTHFFFHRQTEHPHKDHTVDYNMYHLYITGPANASTDIEVCFHYAHNNASWYSTYEEKAQHWPMDTSKSFTKAEPFMTSNFKGNFGSLIEYLFLNSDGFALQLEEYHPWFFRRSVNNGDPLLCFSLDQTKFPYQDAERYINFSLKLQINAARNVREAHQAVMQWRGLIPLPKAIPDETMFRKPIWSTWAQYKKEINQTNVLQFASEIHQRGFPCSQIEIDDFWEKAYGDLTFDQTTFPNATALVEQIHALGYRVTLWAYPFVNFDSVSFNSSLPYLTQTSKGGVANITWWDGHGGIVDFSHYKSTHWFDRLKALQSETKLDSFKFDAGELFWYGTDFHFYEKSVREYPNLITRRYVTSLAEHFGKAIEVRSAFKTQDQGVFVRMLDKNSNWSIDNGLKSLITTALTFSIAGYSFILPDMIGGNAYNGHPSEELYIRWVQANTFLPSMQFSIPPWAYSQSTVNLTLKFINLHIEHAPTIVSLAKKVPSGEPILRPMWYAAPEDSRSYRISDQFMLGQDILVAPVVVEKARERTVYFPPGNWIDQHGKVYSGPVLSKVLAPLEELPYFKRRN